MSRIPIILLLIMYYNTQYAQDANRSLQVNDYFKIKNVLNPELSPDGKWAAYTVTEKDLEKDKSERRLWMINLQEKEAIPMTSKGYSASNPRWSPDGKYLSFLAAKGDKAKSQVWSLDLRGGEAQQVTSIKQGVSGFEWSPDGKKLLLIIKDPKPDQDKENEKEKPKPIVVDRLQFKRDYVGYLDRRRNHLYTYTPGDTIPVQITSGDFDDSQPVWNPDGKHIAFVSNRSDNPDGNSNSDIWVVSADNTDKGETLIRLTSNQREDYAPNWSPDGKTIVYVTVTATREVMWYATNHLATISSSGGSPKIWTQSLDRNVRSPKFTADGHKVLFILEDSGTRNLAELDLKNGNISRIVDGCVSIRDFTLSKNKSVVLMSNPQSPQELYEVQGSNTSVLTKVNQSLLKQLSLSVQENIIFQSGDGTEIEGFVYKPSGFIQGAKYPLILRIHGGPVSQYDCSFRFEPQLFAANGYVVLETNPRGSSGYGQDFSYALFADWGNLDYKDVMAGVDYVLGQGYADSSRMGVGGWSYGGILTNYVITQTERFAGAISGASEALYRSNYGHDHYQRHWEIELGLPWENAEAWERISPFNKVANITTPTLWIGGADDWNVPILNSEQMYQAMKRLGRETQLVVYPNEHHGIRRPSFQKDRFNRYLEWYNKYVKKIQKP